MNDEVCKLDLVRREERRKRSNQNEPDPVKEKIRNWIRSQNKGGQSEKEKGQSRLCNDQKWKIKINKRSGLEGNELKLQRKKGEEKEKLSEIVI